MKRPGPFKLRQDVKFHDGESMTAEDVVFSINRARESNYVSYVVDAISDITADDDYTVTITTKEPYAPLLASLTVPFTAIVPKHAVEVDEEAFTMHPIGTGAYKFVEWKQGEICEAGSKRRVFPGCPEDESTCR